MKYVECKQTVIDLFAKAENPNLINVGICNQIHPTEDLDLNLNDLPLQTQGIPSTKFSYFLLLTNLQILNSKNKRDRL